MKPIIKVEPTTAPSLSAHFDTSGPAMATSPSPTSHSPAVPSLGSKAHPSGYDLNKAFREDDVRLLEPPLATKKSTSKASTKESGKEKASSQKNAVIAVRRVERDAVRRVVEEERIAARAALVCSQCARVGATCEHPEPLQKKRSQTSCKACQKSKRKCSLPAEKAAFDERERIAEANARAMAGMSGLSADGNQHVALQKDLEHLQRLVGDIGEAVVNQNDRLKKVEDKSERQGHQILKHEKRLLRQGEKIHLTYDIAVEAGAAADGAQEAADKAQATMANARVDFDRLGKAMETQAEHMAGIQDMFRVLMGKMNSAVVVGSSGSGCGLLSEPSGSGAITSGSRTSGGYKRKRDGGRAGAEDYEDDR